jgi:hypothetical protein
MSDLRRILLELDDGPDPIAGRIVACDGEGRSFEGYTQLVAALESLRACGPEKEAELA